MLGPQMCILLRFRGEYKGEHKVRPYADAALVKADDKADISDMILKDCGMGADGNICVSGYCSQLFSSVSLALTEYSLPSLKSLIMTSVSGGVRAILFRTSAAPEMGMVFRATMRSPSLRPAC